MLVAKPLNVFGTEFCTATVNTGSVPPRPSPMTMMDPTAPAKLVRSSMAERSNMPVVMSPVLRRACIR